MRWSLALGSLGLASLVGARLLTAPGLLGSPGGEVYGHAWVQWWFGRALLDWPAGPGELLVDGGAWPVIDPLPTLLAGALSRLVGVVAAYDALILLFVALAFLGGAALARRLQGDPWVGGTVLALATPFIGSLTGGLTEDGAVGLAALALAFVGDRDWRRGLLAGFLLGLLTWCGLVLAWYAALAAVVLGLAALLRDRRSLPGLVGGALVALLLALPVALLQGDRLAGTGHSFGTRPEAYEPLWRLNPWGGADLLSLLWPGRVDAGAALVRAHPGYLGFTVLFLLVLSLYRLWDTELPRVGRWLLVLVLAVVLSTGDSLRLAGHPLGIANPVTEWLPLGSLVNHHGRALLLAAVALSALASVGARRLGRFAPWAAAVVAVDLAAHDPVRVPLATASVAPPGVVACAAHPCLDDLSPGGLLVVPVAGPGVHFQRPLLDQRLHGRPLRLNPNRPGLDARTDSERWLASLAFPRQVEPPRPFEAPRGVAVVLAREPYVGRVEAVLGAPDARAADSAAWDLVRSSASE